MAILVAQRHVCLNSPLRLPAVFHLKYSKCQSKSDPNVENLYQIIKLIQTMKLL